MFNVKERNLNPTQGVVGLQILVGQFEEALDSLQGHFGFEYAVEHPGESIERHDQHSYKGHSGEHLQGEENSACLMSLC